VALRRDFLKQAAILAAAPVIGKGQTKAKRLDEFDPANTKIAHRVSSRLSDDDILFLKQIGMRWARVEFGEEEVPFEKLRAIHERFAKQGIGIYSCVQSAYRSVNVQLGRPGRDKDIETYCTFLRDCGRLGIPVASYDFHPGNT
jgi:mannonate dehydratase